MIQNMVPVHILSGFLGSGKTTLLNTLLKSPLLARTAVVINEFGQTGLDHLFVEGRQDSIVELSNGCLCCTIRGELAQTLQSLPVEAIDRVLVETTGLADPGPVLQAVLSLSVAGGQFALGGLVVLLDALNGPQQLAQQNEAALQIALADLVVITKLDLVPQEQENRRVEQLRGLVRSHNPTVDLLRNNELTPQLFLGAGTAISGRVVPAPPGLDHHHHDVSRHGENIRSTVLRAPKPLPMRALEMFCELLTSAHAENLLRLKGIVAIEGEAMPIVVHAIHGVMHEPQFLSHWPDDDHTTRIVVVLRDMDPAFVERLFAGFANLGGVGIPDRAALLDNPLAVPGARLHRQ